MTASPLNDVTRPETCFPNSVAMDVLHFGRFISTATTELVVTVMQQSPLLQKLLGFVFFLQAKYQPRPSETLLPPFYYDTAPCLVM